MTKEYYITSSDTPLSIEEIQALIENGDLMKKDLVWAEGFDDWKPLSQVAVFAEIFAQRDKAASLQLDRVLGTDEDSVKKREMREMLSDMSGEKITMADEKSPVKMILFAAIVIISAAIVLFFLFSDKGETKTEDTAQKPVAEEKININNVKFSSGVTKIDSVEALPFKKNQIKKVSREEREAILAEALMEIKREEAQKDVETKSEKRKPAGKKMNLFAKVTNDELNSFRKKLMNRSAMKEKKVATSGNSTLSTVEEELSPSQIQMVLKKNYGSIKYCYNKSLKADHSLKGKLEVTVHILGSGRVARVETTSQKFRGTHMERCVKEQIKEKWQFPSFNGTMMTIELPFILSSQ